MKTVLHDLRILKLAEMYERAYERFILETATRVVRDERVSEKLRRLGNDDHHARLLAEIARLEAQVSPEDQHEIERAALLDVVAVERAARDFFTQHIDQVHDADVVALFRRIAREEEQHCRVAEEALGMHTTNGRKAQASAEAARKMRILIGEDDIPLREGASDYGLERHLPRRA